MMFDNNKAQETTVSTPLPTGEGSGFLFYCKKIAETEITSAPAHVFFPILKN